MKKRFSKLLLAIVMMLQLVPSSMGTIVANDNVAYEGEFVQVTMENKPAGEYAITSNEIPEGVSKLNVTVNVDGVLKDSKVLTFPGIIDPAKTEVTAKEGYAVEQVTLNGEAFKNNIVYNREAGESEKNLVINVYTKAALTIHYQDANGNKITADDMKEGKLNEKLAFTGKAIDGYTASKDNASEAVLDKASNEVTLVYEKNKAVNKAQISKKADAKASKPVTCSAASSKNCFKADGTYVAENGILYPTEYTAQTGSGKVYHDTNQVGENGKPCANGQVGNLGSDVLPYRHYVVLKYSTDIKVVTYIRCDVYQGMMNPPTPDKDTYKVDFLTSEDLSKLGSIYVNEGEKINEKDVPEAAAKSFYDKRNEDYFWTREQNSNTKVDPATIIINSPTTIYSKGKNKEAVKFTVTFDLAGGVYNNQTENSIVQVENGKKISESAIPVPTLGGKDFKGWNLEGYGNKLYSNKDIAEMNINKNLKFEAVYEKKAYTNEAEYFILLPSSKLPDNLSANYDPNNFVPSNINSWNGPGWNGSNISHDQGTGFSGYISKDAYQKAYVEGKPITNEKGVDSNYIYIPSGNIPAEYTVNNGVDKGKVMKLENIVWYSIKKQDNGKPHVDGYIKAVEVEIGYYANIDGLDSSSIEHAVTGNEYTVKDYSSIRDFPNRTGYIFTGWNTKADGSGTSYAAGERFTVKNSVALYAQWKKTDQKYTIEHIDEDTNTKLKPDETFDAKYGDVINGENHKQTIEGYAFTKADSLKVGTDKEKNIIKIYYSKDANGDNVPDKYQIKVIYKAVNGTIDADHANEPENKTFYVNLYKDGKFATAEDGGVGSLKKDQIGTATAAKGYAQDSLKWTPAAPTTDLKLSKDTEFVAAFEKDSFGYSIEYYYDNIKADTVKKSDKFENVISINPDKSIEYKGNTYALDKTQNNPLTISSDVEKNVIKVFYAEDKNGNGEPDYKEEKYNVNFVAEANGTLAGTTLYNSVLADTKISEIKDYVMPIPQANANYAFDKWIVKDVKHPEGIEIKDPGSYVVTGNTVFYAYFAEDNHGTDPENPDTPDNIPDKYQTEVTFRAVNGSVSFEKTYVTLYDEKGEYSENGTGRLAANQIPATTANNGYHFVNWTPDTPNEDMIISREGAAFTANHAINTYSAVVRFINEDTDEELAPSATLNDIEHGSILYGTEHRIDITGYVFTIADTEIIERNGVVVNVYYAADTKGGVDDPDTTPDGIPDKYQVRFEYTAGTNGSVSGTTIEYVTRPGNSTTASVRPQALVATAANTGYSFVSWTANGNVYSNTDALRNTYFAEDTVFTAGFAVIAAPVLPTPVTPIPPAVTPQTPGTPVPAAPAAPGTTPAATPVIVPVLPTPTPTPTPGPTVDVENPDQPQGGETTDVPDNPTPKAGSEDSWALINLLCAGGTVLLGLILLLSKLKKEEDEEDDKTSAMANKDDEQSERYKRRKWLRLASTITAIVSVIAFFLTEDITLPMILMDKWTLLMAAFLIVQIIFVLFGRKWKELDENDNSTETAHS